jgi:hypothetical protein
MTVVVYFSSVDAFQSLVRMDTRSYETSGSLVASRLSLRNQLAAERMSTVSLELDTRERDLRDLLAKRICQKTGEKQLTPIFAPEDGLILAGENARDPIDALSAGQLSWLI